MHPHSTQLPLLSVSPSALPERLTAKIIVAQNGCWLWHGAKTSSGYGNVMVGSRRDGSRRYVKAHRLVYEFLRGPIPAGTELDHLCRTPVCVHPLHVEAVTHKINVNRGNGHGHETHCPRGHEYSPDNTYINRGKRYCRHCAKDKYAKNRGRYPHW